MWKSEVLFSFFLLSPFFILLFKVGALSSVSFEEVGSALKVTVLQSFASAAVSFIFGLWGALGFRSVRSLKKRQALEILALLPTLLPSLFVVLSFVNGTSFYGLWAIVAVHSLMNIGLVSVLIFHLIESQLGGWATRAYLEGSSQWYFFRKVVLTYLYKDFLLIFMAVFAFCFTSFTVPLLLGGVEFLTLETLIYEKIKISGLWGEAMTLSLIESFFLIFFLIFVKTKFSFPETGSRFSAPFLKMRSGVFLILGISLLVLLSNPITLIEGFGKVGGIPLRGSVLWTLLIGLLVGGASFLLLSFMSFLSWRQGVRETFFQKFLYIYIAPSAAILGFSGLLMAQGGSFFFLILALSLSFFPPLYRLKADSVLNTLEPQVSMAHLLGASEFFIFRSLIWPQTLKPFCFLAGLAAFWACGDFALSTILLETQTPLSLLVENLLSRYRLEEAMVISWIMLLVGLFCFFCWRTLGHVFGQRSLS